MQPDDPSHTPNDTPLQPQQPSNNNQIRQARTTQEAAASIVRSQIDSIYNQETLPAQIIPQTEPIAGTVNPYDRTHQEHVEPQAEQWRQYHSAWQTYYQKYYEGYYAHHLQKAQEAIQAHVITTSAQTGSASFFSDSPVQIPETTLSKNEALYDLRQSLLNKVKNSAIKVHKSRHFVPITAGILVVLLFVFLQYNQILIANVMAYVSPGNINPQNLVVDPNSSVTVGPTSELIVPKINVDVPVAYDIGNDYNSQMAAMTKGVAWFGIPGASSHPGEVGNTVIAGHSSNDLLDQGDYKFIFAQLDKLDVGDTIYANYHSIRYTYVVTGKKVVPPTDVSALIYPTTKPVMTLLTCTPLGTALNRLLVTAEQVSPDPSTSTAAPASSTSNAQPASIPGSGSTLLEKLFGSKG